MIEQNESQRAEMKEDIRKGVREEMYFLFEKKSN